MGAAPARRLGVIAIDPSGFDASVPRDDARAGRAARVRNPRRRARPAASASRCSAAAAATLACPLRAALLALAAVYGLLHARDLAVPGALDAEARSRSPCSRWRRPLLALRAGRRLGAAGARAAALVAAWVSAGPLALARRAARRARRRALADAPSAWVQVVLPFDGEHPELRAAVLIALFAWLAVLGCLWLVPPAAARSPALLATLPFAVSATVYDLPQDPWRALAAAALLLAFLRTGRPAGGGAGDRGRVAGVALLAGAGWSALPAASRPALLPWTTWTFTHARGRRLGRRARLGHALPAARVSAEAGRGAPDARRRARRTGARSCSARSTACASAAISQATVHERHAAGRVRRAGARRAGPRCGPRSP